MLSLGQLYTDDYDAADNNNTNNDGNDTRRTNRDYIGSLACMPNEPKIPIFQVEAGSCVGIRGQDAWLKLLSWFSFTINFILPFFLLAIMNALIICAIRNRGKELRHVNGKCTV